MKAKGKPMDRGTRQSSIEDLIENERPMAGGSMHGRVWFSPVSCVV